MDIFNHFQVVPRNETKSPLRVVSIEEGAVRIYLPESKKHLDFEVVFDTQEGKDAYLSGSRVITNMKACGGKLTLLTPNAKLVDLNQTNQQGDSHTTPPTTLEQLFGVSRSELRRAERLAWKSIVNEYIRHAVQK